MAVDTISNIFLLLFGGLQALLLSAVIFHKGQDKASRYLAAFVILAFCQIFHKVVAKIWLSTHAFGVYKVGYELPLLFGPLVYLYVRAHVFPQKRFDRKILLHFLPFCFLAIIRLLFVYAFPQSSFLLTFIPYTGFHMSIHVSLKLLSLWIYAYLSWKIIHAVILSAPHKKWLKQFVRIVVSIESVIIVALALMVQFYGLYPDLRWLFLSLSVLIYWLSYKYISLIQLSFSGNSNKKSEPIRNKYANSGLTNEAATHISEHLKKLMHETERFRTHGLTLDEVAKELNISKHYLSQVVNTEFDQNFHEFINALRVKAAKKALHNPKNNHLTIAAIAYDVGFQSISNFNLHFKKYTEMTPSAFRKKNLAIIPNLSDK